MASFEQLGAVPSGLTVDELAGTVSKISKELNWLLRNLDDLNISSLSADKITAGTIDADVITVVNLDAANIKAGTIMADVDLIIGIDDAVFKADDNGIYLGNANFADAPFSVDMTGKLYSTSAYIQGTIESSDIIGGTITIGELDSVFKADDYGIYLGNAIFENAPFSVDMNGYLYATNANIKGDISSSTIEGGTVTGAVVATDFEDNVRMEFSGSGFISYNELNQKEGICIETGNWGFSSLSWYDDSGSIFPVGGIAYDTLGNFNILSDTDINIQIWSAENLILRADNYVLPKGVWNCAGANFINLEDISGNRYATELFVTGGYSPLNHSHSYVTFSVLTTEINDAMTEHLNTYHAT